MSTAVLTAEGLEELARKPQTNKKELTNKTVEFILEQRKLNDTYDKRWERFDSVALIEAAAYAVNSFEPDKGYAFLQQVNQVINTRRIFRDLYRSNAEGTYTQPELSDWHLRVLRQFIRAYTQYAPYQGAAAIEYARLPEGFWDDFTRKTGMSEKSIRQIIRTCCMNRVPLDSGGDDDAGSLGEKIPALGGGMMEIENIVFILELGGYFRYVVICGGAEKKDVFEKINANVVFSDESGLLDINSFKEYVDQAYTRFFQANDYEPTDAIIIFQHWFYPVYQTPSEELKDSGEYKSKKVKMSTDYRTPYNKFMDEIWPEYRAKRQAEKKAKNRVQEGTSCPS